MFEGDLSAFRFKSLKKYFHYLITTSRREEKRAVKIYLYTMDPITRWADFFVFFFFLLLADDLKAEGKIQYKSIPKKCNLKK